MTLRLRLSLPWVFGFLAGFMILLFLIDITTQYKEWNERHDLFHTYCEVESPDARNEQGGFFCPVEPSLKRTFELVRLRFDADREGTVPTWFSVVMEFTCGLALLAIGFRSRQSGGKMFVPWVVLGFIFFYLSIDDLVQIHELLGGDNSLGHRLNQHLGIKFITFDWVIPAVILLLILLPFFIPFFFRLPQGTFALFALAGFLFIFTQVGMESYAGKHLMPNTMKYHWESVLEDGPGKHSSLIVMLFALLAYVRDNLETVRQQPLATVADWPVLRQIAGLPFLRQLTARGAPTAEEEQEPVAAGER